MNIYIHVEISSRELDSKLLLAVIAALKGHEVLVSDLGTILRGVKSRVLRPGIFHTKCLTPTPSKFFRHKELSDHGFLITSQDEEAGLTRYGYQEFARRRYSSEMLEHASAVFSWGHEDAETLKQTYPRYASRMYATGSPRVDLWRPEARRYWPLPPSAPKRPFLLISSTMTRANSRRPLHEAIAADKRDGHFVKTPPDFKKRFGAVIEAYRHTLAFIEAIQELSRSGDGYDIVFRPHPGESIDAWKVYLDGIPSVHVIREGSITAWVNGAFAVVHNGCTTAIEATVARTPVITYLPFDPEHSGKLANDLGATASCPSSLSRMVGDIYRNSGEDKAPALPAPPPQLLDGKLLIERELSAEKIVKVWESLDNGKLSAAWGSKGFRLLMQLGKLKRFAGIFSERLLGKPAQLQRANLKFEPMKQSDIANRVNRIQAIFGFEGDLRCELITTRAVLLKKRD